MNIEKTSEKYALVREGEDWVVEMGRTKQFENKTVELLISNLSDATNTTVHITCGCTSPTRQEVDSTTLKVTLTYNDCDRTFSKTTNIKTNGKQIAKIKMRGECQ